MDHCELLLRASHAAATANASGEDDSPWLSGSDLDLLLADPLLSVTCGNEASAGKLYSRSPDTQFGASFDIPNVSRSAERHRPERLGDLLRPAELLLPHLSASCPQVQDGLSAGSGSTLKSQSGENETSCEDDASDLRAPRALPSHGRSNARGSGWQRTGIGKRSRLKPRQRAQASQVAELKGRVAELTSRCSQMERALSQHGMQQQQQHPPQTSPKLDGLLSAAGLDQKSTSLPDGFKRRDSDPRLSLSDVRAASMPQGRQAPVEPAHAEVTPISHMNFSQFGRLYRSRVSRLAVQLGSLSQRDNDRAVEELKQATSEVLLLVMRCCMDNSLAAKLWMQESFKAEQLRPESEEDGGFWKSTASSLELTEDQRQAVVELRRAFLTRLEDLRNRRHLIAQSLAGTLPSAFRNRLSAVAQLGALQKADALKLNVKECDRLICDFVSSLMSHILTPIQLARCLVSAYPYWPDMLVISTYVAAAAGESSAIGMLHQEFAGVSIAASS